MNRRKLLERISFASLPLVAAVCLSAVCRAEPPVRPNVREPVYAVERMSHNQPADNQAARQHPLVPAVEYAREGLQTIRTNVKDYSCTMVKRERIDGELMDPEFIYSKIRSEQRDENGNVTVPFRRVHVLRQAR